MRKPFSHVIKSDIHHGLFMSGPIGAIEWVMNHAKHNYVHRFFQSHLFITQGGPKHSKIHPTDLFDKEASKVT